MASAGHKTTQWAKPPLYVEPFSVGVLSTSSVPWASCARFVTLSSLLCYRSVQPGKDWCVTPGLGGNGDMKARWHDAC